MAEVEFQFHVAATKVSSPFTTALSHLSNTRLRIRIPERQCDQVLRAIGQGNGADQPQPGDRRGISLAVVQKLCSRINLGL